MANQESDSSGASAFCIFICPFCDKKHNRKYNLQRHINTVHATEASESNGRDRNKKVVESLLKMFLFCSLCESMEHVDFLCSSAAFLILKSPQNTFDILWKLAKLLHPLNKMHRLFELFSSENLMKMAVAFGPGEAEQEPSEFRTALHDLVRYLSELDTKSDFVTRFLDNAVLYRYALDLFH